MFEQWRKTLSKKQNQKKLSQRILQTIKEEKPETVAQLVKSLLDKEKSFSRAEITDQIFRLQSEGLLVLKETENERVPQFSVYLRSARAYWFWATISIAVITVLLAFTIPENAYPLVYIRYGLGMIFVLLLPGYSFIRALFPAKLSFMKVSENMDSLLRFALGFGVSIGLIPITGLVLSFTPLGLYQTSIVLTLFSMTAVFATLAVAREFMYQLREKPE